MSPAACQEDPLDVHSENARNAPLILGRLFSSGDDVADHLWLCVESAGDLSLGDPFGEDEGFDQSFFGIINLAVAFLFHLVYLYSN